MNKKGSETAEEEEEEEEEGKDSIFFYFLSSPATAALEKTKGKVHYSVGNDSFHVINVRRKIPSKQYRFMHCGSWKVEKGMISFLSSSLLYWAQLFYTKNGGKVFKRSNLTFKRLPLCKAHSFS